MAFLACGGYSLGDFLAFNVNFQPNLLVPVFVGQICGGIIGILFAKAPGGSAGAGAGAGDGSVRHAGRAFSARPACCGSPHLGSRNGHSSGCQRSEKFNAIQILQSLDEPT